MEYFAASLIGIVTLTLVVLPGIVLELLRQRSRPGRIESTFVETSRVLLGGAAVTMVSLALIGAVRTVTRGTVADPGKLLADPHYVADHLWLVGWTVGYFFVVSTTVSALFFALSPVHGLSGNVAMESAWVSVFSGLARRVTDEQWAALGNRQMVTQVQVNLIDGHTYVGTRDSYSADIEPDRRELVLAPPLQEAAANGELRALDPGWQRLIIPGSQIRSMLVRFAAGTAQPEPASRPPSMRAARTAQRLLSSPAVLGVALALELSVVTLIGLATR